MKTSFRERIFSVDVQSDELSLSGKSEIGGVSERKRGPALLKKIVAFSVILICFFFLGKTLYRNLGQISAYQWSLKPSFLILSFLFLVTNLAISAFAWKKILYLFEVRLPFNQSFKIMFVSGLGKYLPGKVWLYLSQIYLAGKAKIPKSVTLFSMFLLFGGYTIAGVLIFIFSLFFWQRFSPMLVSLLFLTSLGIFLIFFSPRILNHILKILTSISKKFKEGLIPEELTARGGIRQIGQIILILMADWIIFGVAVYFLVNSFYHIDLSQTVIICGIFAISVILGILIFFVPAGLGVREGVLSYLLSLFIPVSAAILISLVMRVWIASGELVCFLVALKIKKPELW
jgi:uncharacterized membrane protein YbhN (UPF0104 family)